MNPCELIARLNPAAARLDGGGRGGIPELTPQDIAAAIGMVGDVLAREVFCAIWWPDGARLVWKELDSLIAALQFGEWRERADAIVVAQIAVAQAPFHPERFRENAAHKAELMLAKARASMWPSLCEDIYRDIRAAVICELRAPRTCAACNGRGEVRPDNVVVSCGVCRGSGRTSISDSQRALMLKRNESSYRRSWKDVYEWTYNRVAEAESTGRIEFTKRLDHAA